MMTKFILHGGGTRKDSAKNKNFFQQISTASKGGDLLIVCFAQPKKEWKKHFEHEKKKFSHIRSDLNFILADNSPKKFCQQIKKANAIYIKGGDDGLLQKKIKPIENFEELIQGKTIAGSSAGANFLSKYYYSTDNNRIEEGIGILQIKLFTHYTPNHRTGLRELFTYKDDLEIINLLETDFTIISIHT